MSNTIGTLLVELGVNTAAFKGGLDKATYMAQAFAKDIKAQFSSVGDSVRELVGSMGAFGGQAGAALSGVTKVLEPLLTGVGGVAGATVGLAAAFAVAGVGALGVAVHFSETAARLDELSQATGMTVEQISALGNIASTKGISVDLMARAIERMDRSALKAAQSGPNAASAYKDLGINVTDASGKMLAADEIFNKVAQRFSEMPDGPRKTAEAIKIFGRTGAELIPLLNEGGSKLEELKGHFEALNATVSGSTAAASDELKENMTLMGAAFTGVENQLTADLVPALNVAAKSFIDFFEKNQSSIKAFADGLAEVGKVTLNVFQEIGLIFSLIYKAFSLAVEELQNIGGTLTNVLGDLWDRNWKKASADAKAGGKQIAGSLVEGLKDGAKSITDTLASMVGVVSATAPKAKAKRGTEDEDVNKNANVDFVQKAVQQAEQGADKLGRMTKTINELGAAEIEAAAAATADTQAEKLRDEAIQKGIAPSAAFKAALAAAIPELKMAALWTETFKAALEADKQFKGFETKMLAQITTYREASAATDAYTKEQGKLDGQLDPMRLKLKQLTDEYFKLATAPGADPKRVRELHDAIVNLNVELDKEQAMVKDVSSAWVASKVAEYINKTKLETAQLHEENMLMVSGNPYGKMEADLAKYVSENHVGVQDAITMLDDLKKKEQELSAQGALKVATSLGFDKNGVQMFEDEKKALADAGLSGEAYAKTLQKINAEELALQAKQGGFFDGAKAGFAQWQASLESSGQMMSKLVSSALDGITNNFAQMVATGKASWASLEQSMEEQMLKFAMSNILSTVLKSIKSMLSNSDNGFLSSLGSVFGGMKADGGDMTPGKSYIVGERGPEIIKAGSAGGTVIPNDQIGMGGGGRSVTVIQNIQSPDIDSFKRSATQLHTMAYVQASAHAARMKA